MKFAQNGKACSGKKEPGTLIKLFK